MTLLLTAIHVVLCLLLIIIILLQSGKGAEMGAVFGGSSQTIFGSRGAATFLSKVTTFCAIGFMCTSLLLVWINAKQSSSSLMDQKGAKSEQSAPAATTEPNSAVPQEAAGTPAETKPAPTKK